MSRRTAGVTFCAIAALLFAVRYLAAAIYIAGTNTSEFSAEMFKRWMGYVGSLPWTLAGLSLLVGIGYLIWAELEK
jgi:hypothetical protein